MNHLVTTYLSPGLVEEGSDLVPEELHHPVLLVVPGRGNTFMG